jgi:hypothetical protein
MNNRKIILRGIGFLFLPSFFLNLQAYKTTLSQGALTTRLPGVFSTWERERGNIDLHRYGGVIEAFPFFQSMGESKKLDRYFGMKGADQKWTDYIEVGPNASLKSEDLIHDQGNALHPERRSLHDRVYFRPEQKVRGVQLVYFQQLCDFSKYFALSFHLPIVSVENNMGLYSPSAGTSQVLRLPKDVTSAQPYSGKQVDFTDFLEGRVSNDAGSNIQEPLKKMKIVRRTLKSQGPSDLTVRAHCLLSYREELAFDISGHCMIPFESRPRGEYLFAPVRGNAGHWGMGVKGEAAARVFFNNKTTSLHFVGSAEYDYIFKGVEHRAIGYNRFDKEDIPWGLYRLGGTLGEKKVEPLANMLTQEVKVKPEDRFTFSGACAVQHNNFYLACGTEVYVQSQETLRLTSFKERTYNLAAIDYNTSVPFDPILHRHQQDGFLKGMEKQDLALRSATTEQLCTQTVYAHALATIEYEDAQLVLGAGSGYLFLHSNESQGLGNRWILWTRVGILF